ncbi:cadherin-like protein 26 isoform X1 [Oryzias melastigma]|nr:cadherin-like protein 26 isoform X1 [Oryzias melastigma]
MKITFLVLLVIFPALSFCSGCENARKKRDLLLRTKRRWVLSTFQIEEEMTVIYPYFLSKTYNDKSASGKFRFEISGDAVDQGYLSIDENTGAIYLHKPVDREKHPRFHVIFDVYDKETNLKIDKKLAFNVDVNDINDNPPQFINIPETVTVKENQEEGLLGVEVIAYDPDEENSLNSRFNISVIAQHPPEPKIQAKWISERMVHLTVDGCFNYEKDKKHSITLEAKDHGTPPMSSTAVIMLNVVDSNTNKYMPVFKEREYQTFAVEMETHDDILRLAVDDKDSSNTDGWHAKYFFISGNEEDIFKLETDPITNEGILSITKKKKYGKITTVNLRIGVENIEPFSKCENGKLIKQGSKLPDSVSVKILMIKTNHPPEFQKTNIDVFEKEESDPGKVLFTPEVHDPDSTSFRFVLVEDPANWVSVDEKTGEIRTTKKMDRESPFVDDDNVYKVVIAAIDDDFPPASSSCTISIHLGDINDHKPHLVNSSLIMCGHRNNKVMLYVEDLDADPYSGPFSFHLDDYEDMKQWKLDPAYGQQGGLVTLKPLPSGNFSVSLLIRDKQNNIGRNTLEVQVLVCGDRYTSYLKKICMREDAFGPIIAGLLLFLLLLLAFSWTCQYLPFKDLGEGETQTPIFYNQEGGVPVCNTEVVCLPPTSGPVYIYSTKPTVTPQKMNNNFYQRNPT